MQLPQSQSWLSFVVALLSVVSLGALTLSLSACVDRRHTGWPMLGGVGPCPLPNRFLLVLLGMMALSYSSIHLLAYFLLRGASLGTDENRVLFSIIAQMMLYAVIATTLTVLLRLLGRSWTSAFGFRTDVRAKLIFDVGAALCACLIPTTIAKAVSLQVLRWLDWPIEPQAAIKLLLAAKSMGLKCLMVFIATVGAPLIEEILFRGILYPWLKDRVGFFKALILNSLVFGAVHGSLENLLPLVLLAIGFTLVYEWTRNLAAPILMHMGFNSLSITLLLVFKKDL